MNGGAGIMTLCKNKTPCQYYCKILDIMNGGAGFDAV